MVNQMSDYFSQVINDFIKNKIKCEHEFVILNKDVNCFECQDCKSLFDADSIPSAPDGTTQPSHYVDATMNSPYSGPDKKNNWEDRIGDICSKYLQKNLPFTGYTRWDQKTEIVEWGEGNETE
jgi:hypothetical protein